MALRMLHVYMTIRVPRPDLGRNNSCFPPVLYLPLIYTVYYPQSETDIHRAYISSSMYVDYSQHRVWIIRVKAKVANRARVVS